MSRCLAICLALVFAMAMSGCRGDRSDPDHSDRAASSATTGTTPPRAGNGAAPSVPAPADAAVQDHDAAPAEPEARAWRFDDAPVAASPPGMTPHTGTWTIAAETPDPGANRVAAQTAKNANPVFNLLLIDDVETRDVDISVRLRAISGSLDQGGGLVWRAVDARNYYIARYNPLETNLRVYKVVRGKRGQLASADIDLPSDAWHTLRIVMRDDRITASMNNVTHLDLRDPTFRSAGRIGLWTKADAHTYFDDLTLREDSAGSDPDGPTNSD